jgi:hypothetical protein
MRCAPAQEETTPGDHAWCVLLRVNSRMIFSGVAQSSLTALDKGGLEGK